MLLLAWLWLALVPSRIETKSDSSVLTQFSNDEPLDWYFRWFDDFHHSADDWTDVPPAEVAPSLTRWRVPEFEREDPVEWSPTVTVPPEYLPMFKHLNVSSPGDDSDESDDVSTDWVEDEYDDFVIIEFPSEYDDSAHDSDSSVVVVGDSNGTFDSAHSNDSSDFSPLPNDSSFFNFLDWSRPWLDYNESDAANGDYSELEVEEDPNTNGDYSEVPKHPNTNRGHLTYPNTNRDHLEYTKYPITNGARNASDAYSRYSSTPNDTLAQNTTTRDAMKENKRNGSVAKSVPENLWRYLSPPIALGGSVGNALAFSVLSRKQMMKKTATLYLLVLSVVDTLLLDMDLLNRWLKVTVDFDLRVQSDASCKLYMGSVYLLHQLASWLIVLATVERTVALFYPWYAKDLFTKRYEAVVLGIVTLLLVIFNAHFLVTQEVFPVYHRTTGERDVACSSYWGHHRWFVHKIWPWIDLTLFAVVPFAVIILCNAYIAGQFVMFRVSQPVEAPDIELQAEPGTSRQERSVRAARIEERHEAKGWVGGGLTGVGRKTTWRPKLVSVTKMVIITNTAFLVTSLPLCIILVGDSILLNGAGQSSMELLHIVWVSTHLLANVFQACKFLLYWLISQKIRQTFRRLCRHQIVEIADMEPTVTIDTGL